MQGLPSERSIGEYWGVSYFTAAISLAGDAWRSHDIPIDEFDDMADLSEALREVVQDGSPAFAFIEHEDEWFAVIRSDGDEDVAVFVTDELAAFASPYGGMLRESLEQYEAVDVADVDDAPAAEKEADSSSMDMPDQVSKPVLEQRMHAGDSGVFADLGLESAALLAIVAEFDGDPAAMLADIGDALGMADVFEGLR